MLLIVDLDECIRVLNSHTQLDKILGKSLVTDLVLDGLYEQKLHQGKTHLGLFLVELLVTTQLDELVLIVLHSRQFLHELGQH